jgi:hypothetical protein
MPITVNDPRYGHTGEIHELDIKQGSILIFQLPRRTEHLSEVYVNNAKRVLNEQFPGVTCVIMGADVNVYEVCGEDAAVLKLKGIL